MDRSKYSGLYGGAPREPAAHAIPPRRPQVPSWSAQDARSTHSVRNNLAVQPAENVGTLKLKKKAVKIVGSATALSSVPRATPSPLESTSTSTAAVVGNPGESESYASDTPETLVPTVQAAQKNTETPRQSNAAEDTLDDIFTRLMAPGKLARPIQSTFSFESSLSEADVGKKILGNLVANSPSGSVKAKGAEHTELASSKVTSNAPLEMDGTNKFSGDNTNGAVKSRKQGLSQQELETEYIRKALEYVNALPGNKGTTAYTFKLVAKKLRDLYIPMMGISPEEIETLKARYVFAVTNYVKGLNKGTTSLTADAVEQILESNDGDFLRLCATLVEQKYVALNNLDEIGGLCKTVLNILPTSEPVGNMTEWPSREKRENPAGFRTCILKGIAGVKTINQLQALVWGGKLEAISMPDSSGFGTVRFLTAEGCQKYYEETQNGIEIPGENDKKTIVLVERTEGPNSTNDVMRACASGDATRCVRAVGADDGWDATLLMKLARGQGKIKRELDTIKRGQTSRGYNYVEFRFANIYHALSFKRQLMNEEDWEHCTINYAPDPCEVACGVHDKDGE